MVVKTLTKDDMTQGEIIETVIRKPILQRAIQMHVCSLCLRVYDLLEDLLGHMIEYHHYKRATDVESNKNKASEEEKENVIEPSKTEQQVGTIVSQPSTKEASNSAVNQLAPMSYKELRLFLRKNWKVPCRLYAKCPYKFENNVSAVFHAKCHIAGDMERFKCFKCNLKLTTWRRCAAHLWLSHQLEADLLHCPLCEYKTYTTVNIWEHMRVHRNWHVERAKLKKKLTKSTKMIAGDNASKGSNLNRYYSQKVCTICQRKFVNGKTLSKHVKTVHNNIKPFRCNICGMKTARKASLVIHMRQHTGEKPLKCKKCAFATRDPSVLHKHQLRHEKTKKLKCSFCDYSCIQTNLYKRHMRLKHPQEYKKIACDICSFVTITTEKLLAHKEDHQRGLIGNTEDSADTGYRSASKHTGNPNADCFMPLESIDSLPHEPAVDTGGVTIPAPPNEDTQFPLYLND